MRRGHVSAAAMKARMVPEPGGFRNRHCSADEYDAFLARCDVAKHFVQQRRSHRKLFVEAWPDLDMWLRAPLAERIGRINGQTRVTLHNRPSYWARAYLYYLALSGHLRIDYDWLLAIGDLCVHDVVHHMQIDLGVKALAQEASALGLHHAHADRAMRWTLGRIALHSGPRRVGELVDDDVDRLLVAVREFGERPDLADYWTSADRYRTVSKAWITMIGQLRLVLYHRGQVHEAPRKIMPSADVRAAQPAMAALIDQWLQRRAPALRPGTLYHHALTARSFLDHLAVAAPEVQTFTAVKHQHVISCERHGDRSVDEDRTALDDAFAARAGRSPGAVLQRCRGLGLDRGAAMAAGRPSRSAAPTRLHPALYSASRSRSADGCDPGAS